MGGVGAIGSAVAATGCPETAAFARDVTGPSARARYPPARPASGSSTSHPNAGPVASASRGVAPTAPP